MFLRFLFVLFFGLLATIPAWFAWREILLVYDGLWSMWVDYSFQKEMYVRGHIFSALLSFMILLAISDRVSTSPEERRRVKELVQRQRNEEVRRIMQPRFLPKIR